MDFGEAGGGILQLEVSEDTLIAPVTTIRIRETACALGTDANCIASYKN